MTEKDRDAIIDNLLNPDGDLTAAERGQKAMAERVEGKRFRPTMAMHRYMVNEIATLQSRLKAMEQERDQYRRRLDEGLTGIRLEYEVAIKHLNGEVERLQRVLAQQENEQEINYDLRNVEPVNTPLWKRIMGLA